MQEGESSRIRSSNYKYLLQVWTVVKSVPHLYGIQKFFAFGPASVTNRWNTRSNRVRADNAPAIQVEVVAGDACRTRYFLKISTMDEKRLGHDLVRIQWDEGDSSDEKEEMDESNEVECNGGGDNLISQTHIGTLARQLVSVAELSGAIPILILPYLSRDHDHGLFAFLDSIGLRYHCQSDEYPIFDYAPNVRKPQSPNAPPRRIALDITTLLSIVADVCNMDPKAIQYDKDTFAQIDQAEWEERAPILPETIFPFLQTACELIAPPGVYSKMNTLLETIGSETEKERAAILFGKSLSTVEPLTEQYNHLTIYPIPSSVALPIKVSSVGDDVRSPVSHEDMEKLSIEATEVYNLAVTIEGGCEVATANKQLAKMIRAYYFVERNGMGISGRVLLHQPRSLRGFGKIVHLPMKEIHQLTRGL